MKSCCSSASCLLNLKARLLCAAVGPQYGSSSPLPSAGLPASFILQCLLNATGGGSGGKLYMPFSEMRVCAANGNLLAIFVGDDDDDRKESVEEIRKFKKSRRRKKATVL